MVHVKQLNVLWTMVPTFHQEYPLMIMGVRDKSVKLSMDIPHYIQYHQTVQNLIKTVPQRTLLPRTVAHFV